MILSGPDDSNASTSAPEPLKEKTRWPKWATLLLCIGGPVALIYLVTRKSVSFTPNPDDEKLVASALRSHQKFHWGNRPDALRLMAVSPQPRVGYELGELEGVMYRSAKNGQQVRRYYHTFGEEGGSRPRLVADQKNSKLHIVGGDYRVEPRGIVD